jgi:carboxylesterase type B
MTDFDSIRFAAPPLGSLRWQLPQPPSSNRSSVLSAAEFGPSCPQSVNSGSGFVVPDIPVSEDCLFLSVYSPANATNLPVLVWIHGGGYGAGSGTQDLSGFVNGNSNSFIAVSIQYRVSKT